VDRGPGTGLLWKRVSQRPAILGVWDAAAFAAARVNDPARSPDMPTERNETFIQLVGNASIGPIVQAGIGVAVLVVMIAAAFWLLARFRDYTAQDGLDQQQPELNLEEMRRRGDISEEEFRTIQSATRGSTNATSTAAVPSASQAESDSDVRSESASAAGPPDSGGDSTDVP